MLKVFAFERFGERVLVALDCIKRREFHVIVNVIERRHTEASTRHILNGLDRYTLMQVRRDLEERPLAHAVDEQVGHAVDEDGAPHIIRPIIVMREPAQARLDAADDDRHIGIQLAQAARVDDRRTFRPAAAFAARRILVLMKFLLRRRELVEQRIHVAGRDEERETRFSETVEIPRRMPVRLCDDADAIAVRFQ